MKYWRLDGFGKWKIEIWSGELVDGYHILTCLSHNEKIEKISEQNAPPSLLPQPPSWDWVMGSRVSAESHPHRSTRTRELQCSLVTFFYSLICSLVGVFLWLSRGIASFWCQVFFRSSAVVNSDYSCPNSASVLSSCFSWYQLTWNCLQLEFSDNYRFKAGVHVKAV